LAVQIHARGNDFKIDGEPKDVETVEKILSDFAELFNEGNTFNDKELRDAFKQIAEDRAYSLKNHFTKSRFNPSGKKTVAAKTANQRKYLEAIQDHDLTFGIGPAGTGKCLAGDSLVITNLGMIEIGELCKHTEVDKFSPADFYTHGLNGIEKVAFTYNGGESKTLVFSTKFGYQIETTPEHPLLTIQTDGNLSWKRADQLEIGDFVALQRGQQMFGSRNKVEFQPKIHKNDKKSKPVNIECLDSDFAYILGLLVGDGCLTAKNRILLASIDEEIILAFKDFAERLNLHIFPNSDKNFVIASSQLYQLLLFLGLSNGKAETKQIPKAILTAPQEVVSAFLSGLFDADGTVEKRDGTIIFSTISEKLVSQLQTVLLNFGIVCSKANKRGTYLGKPHFSYILTISGEEAEKFDDLIGFKLERKRLRRILKKNNPNVDFIPHLSGHLNKAVKSAVLTRSEHKVFWDYRINRRRPSYKKLSDLLTILNEKGAKNDSIFYLQQILENRLLFLEIKSIEKSQTKVYDLNVPETHSFTANGFVNHNSYLSVAMAVQALFSKQVSRIILTRPAVEAGEKLGFLPGDLQDKVDPYLRPLYDALFDLVDAEKVTKMLEKRIIEIAPLAFMRGRSQPLESKILTPKGWKKMGDIKLNDNVIGSDGKAIKVIGIFPQGKKKVFRVIMTDGSSALACSEHLWQVKTLEDKRRNKSPRVLETQEMLDNYRRNNQYRYEIPLISSPIDWKFQNTTIEPYGLGLILGDGCISGKTSPCFTTADTELAFALKTSFSKMDLVIKQKAKFEYTIINPFVKKGGNKHEFVRNPLNESLEKLNLLGTISSTKFIPKEYLFNSAEVRIALLQGLLDTDGGPVVQEKRTCRIHYSTSSEELKNDVIFLVRSLGGIVNWRKRLANGRKPGFANGRFIYHRNDSYVLDIRLPKDIKPFRLKRKAEIYEKFGGGRPMRFIKHIEYVGEMETQCIKVDAIDSLYVTDDFILTHNTLNDSFIILDEAQNTTGEQMKMFLTRIGFGSKVVVTGDKTQVDLPRGQRSGIFEAERVLQNIPEIEFVYFNKADVVRHRLVQLIVEAYEKESEENREV
jgi:phosphate starvation-inducible PhoH-like protein